MKWVEGYWCYLLQSCPFSIHLPSLFFIFFFFFLTFRSDDVLSLYWPCLNVSTFMRFTRWDRKWWWAREMKWGWWWHYSWAFFRSHSRCFASLTCSSSTALAGAFYARHATYLKCDWSCCGNDAFVALLVVDDDDKIKINEKAALKSVTNFNVFAGSAAVF